MKAAAASAQAGGPRLRLEDAASTLSLDSSHRRICALQRGALPDRPRGCRARLERRRHRRGDRLALVAARRRSGDGDDARRDVRGGQRRRRRLRALCVPNARAPASTSAEAAAAAAGYRVLSGLYPQQRESLDKAWAASRQKLEGTPGFAAGTAIGEQAVPSADARAALPALSATIAR